MAHFNEKKTSGTTNLAGGKAYKESANMQLASLLLTSFGGDKYYQNSKQVFDALERLISESDKLFAAKAIVYARREFGMRTITHYAASILAKYAVGQHWARDFFRAVVRRPDDITEILACHFSRKEKVTNAMKKGFADAIGRFDAYQLAKYRGEGNAVKLVDAVNICHPKETERTNGALSLLVKSELKSSDTWESELSAAGSDIEAKKSVWRRLISENKLGYFALLRNIRNIVNLGDAELKQMALDALMNEKAIRKSLVLPFRFSTAYKELATIDRDAMRAISRACELACFNVPKLSGKTLVALDVSGSMQSANVAETASLFAAVLAKSNDCDIITYADNSQYKIVNPDDSLMTIKDSLKFASGGTNFNAVFQVANKHYDRIILLSDMQAWTATGYNWIQGHFDARPSASYNAYKRKYNSDCKCYSVDLAGYGTLQLPEKDVYCLAGFSEKIFDLMALLESDKNALVNAINEILL